MGAGRVRLADPTAGITADLPGRPWRLCARRRPADRAQRGRRDRRVGPCRKGPVVDLADCRGRRRWRLPRRHRLLSAWSQRRRLRRSAAVPEPQGQGPAHLGRSGPGAAWRHHRRGRPLVPGGRTATTFTGGVVRLPWPRFAAADAVGASLWAAYAAGLGYLGGETFERRPLYAFLLGLGVALLVALVVEAARRLRRRGARPENRGALGGRPRR